MISRLLKDISRGTGRTIVFVLALLSFFLSLLTPYSVFAQANQVPAVNLNDSGFHLLQCDGPALPSNVAPPANLGHTYVPCDFKGLMIELQFLLNAMTVLAVLAALVGFAYAGFLYVTGKESNINKAREIFPKIALGFILILTAWFIVYQILSWLTGNATSYLGNGS